MCYPMGCGTSTDSVSATPQHSDYYADRASGISRVNMPTDQTILEAFTRLETEIGRLKEQCPGPRLITIEAWIKYLESKQTILSNDVVQLPLHMLDEDFDEEQELAKYSRRTRLKNDAESLAKVRQLTESLNVMTDATQAAKYEEFLANVNRRFIENCSEVFKEDILEIAHKRADELRAMLSTLRLKYHELDSLLASVTGNNYTNRDEMRIDTELEASRQVRDKLGGAAEQWRTSANLLRTSAKSALLAKEQYAIIQNSNLVTDKIAAATECGSALLGSLVAFRCAQEALPQVDIPHITHRQTVAVGHANEYLFTDIANPDRYQHTKEVLDAFQKSLSTSIIWLHEVFEKTLKKDLKEAEVEVKSLSSRLRQIRTEYIQTKSGYQRYTPIDQGHLRRMEH